MTSTNDGKDVKCNQISGQKGKTHYIELYKSLDSRLSGECGLRERTAAVCAAWRAVHRLCLHSAHNTTAHLLSWLQRHTANTILQTEWQSPSSKDEHARLEQAIDDFTAECVEARGARASPAWETQLLQRGAWFKRVLSNPWGHPVLKTLLDPLGRPTDQQIVEWLKEERGVMFVTRLRVMAAGHCDDLAVLLAAAVMGRVRRDLPTDHEIADHREKPQPKPETEGPSFREILMSEAGFTVDVWELLTDIEFVLLHKAGRSSQCIDLAKRTPLRNGYQLVERLQSRLETSPREKKLWKNARDVAILIAQVVIARCMVVPTCAGVCRSALYCCARSLVRLLPPRRLPPAAASLAAPACTARHLHTLAAAVHAECTSEMKPFVCELYIRAITAGMNELERLKVKTETEADARAAEQTLALWFVALGEVLAGSDRVRAECALTAFSLHPAPAMYDLIHNAPALKPVSAENQEPKVDEATSEFGSWASDSRTKTNLVKTSETLNIKKTEKHSNVLSTAILTEGEALGLSPELCQDLAVLLSGPRLKTLTWDLDRDALLAKCVGHMERTHGGTRALTTELRFLNLDPSHYQHLPEDDEDENDIYYGIEKGYEHHVDFQEEPVFDNERTETAASSDTESDDAVVARRKKKATRLAESEDDETLSHIAEQNRIEKKERQNRDRSKDKDKTSQDRDKSKQKKDKRDRKKEKKKERKKKKAQQKEMDNQPLGSLSCLIGMKVSVPNERKIETVTVPPAPPVSDGENDSQGKVNSERIETEVVFDGVYSMDEIKSPERVLPATKPNAIKVAPSRPLFGTKKAVPSHLSPVNEQVKRSINKLLSIRRQQYTLDPRAAAKNSANKVGPPPKSNAIKNPDVSLTGQVSPKVVNIPEIPKTYISKNQVEAINARQNLSAVRKEPTKPVVQNPKVTSTMSVNVPTVLNNDLPKNSAGSLQHRGFSNNMLPKSSNTLPESRKTYPLTLSESRKTRPITPSESRKTHPINQSESRKTHPLTMTQSINTHPNNMPECRKTHSNAMTESRITYPNSMTESRKTHSNAITESRITYPSSMTESRKTLSNAVTESRPPYPNSMTDSRKTHLNAMTESRVTYPNTMTESRKILSNVVTENRTSCLNTMSESLKSQSNVISESRNIHPNAIAESRSNHLNPMPENQNIYIQNHNIPPTPATDLSQQSFHDFLKELQKTINAGAGVDKTANVIQNRPYAGHIETGSANRMSPIIPPSEVKVPNIQDTNPAPQCAKQITQKKDTLNTFSRLSYLHKSKITEKTKQAIMYNPREQEALNSEITEHKNAKMKYYQAKNDVAVSRIIHSGPKPETCQPLNHHVKKIDKQNSVVAMEHPILSDILQSQLQDAHDFVMSNTQQQRVTQPNNTLLAEQENMLLLVRQQNNVNTQHSDVKITSAKVPLITQCSITNLQPTIKCNYIQSSTVTPTHVTNVNKILSSNTLELLRPHVNVQKVSGNNGDIKTNEKIQTVPKPVHSIAKAGLQHKTSDPKRDMNKSVEKPTSKGDKKLDWESVMNAIRAQKTPSRGPNALDLALKKDSVERAYSESVLRKQRIGRTHSSGDASARNKSALLKHNDTATKPKSNVPESQHTPNTQGLDKTKANNHKHEKSKGINHTLGNDNSKVVVLGQEPMEGPNQTHLHKKHAKKSSSLPKKQFTCLQKEEDPFISGIQNSDYDLLEELMDDDLRQEIGELSSDDESFLETRFQNHKLYKNNVTIKTIPAVNKDSIPPIQDNINVVDTYIQQGPHGIIKKAALQSNFAKNNKQHPLVGTSIITGTKVMLPKSQTNPDAALTNSTTRPPTVQHLPANIMLTPKSDTKQFITPSCNIALNQPNIQSSNIFVAPVAHQKSLQKVVIIGSELVYDPYTVQAPIHAAATAPAQSAQAAYVTINAPNMALYQTAQYDAPIANPLIIENVNMPTDTEPATPVEVSNSLPNNVDSMTIINPLDIPSLPETISADEQLNEIVTENIDNLKTVPVKEVTVTKEDKITRDVNSNEKSESKELPPVQEKQKVKKPRKQSSKRKITKDTKVLERVNMKRLAIINRDINHRCSNSPIPLTYTPLHYTNTPDIQNKLPDITDTKQTDTEETKCDDSSIIKNISIVDFETNEISTPASHYSNDNRQENDDETVQCRRILLRSSNKIKTKVSTSNGVAANQVVKKTKVRLKRLKEVNDNNSQQEHHRSEIETQEVLEKNGNKTKEPQIVSKKVKKGLPKQKRKQKNNKKSRRDKLSANQKQQNEETNGEVSTLYGLKVNIEDALMGLKIPKIVISKKECINNNDSGVSTEPELTEYQSKLVDSSVPTVLPEILEDPTDPKTTNENEVNTFATNSLPPSEILTNVSQTIPEMFVDELAELTLCTESVIANMTIDNVSELEAAVADIEVTNCLQNLEDNDLSITPVAAMVPNTDKIPEASSIVSQTEMIVGAQHINIDTPQVVDDDDDVIILTQEENIPSKNTSMEDNFDKTSDSRLQGGDPTKNIAASMDKDVLDKDTNAIDKHSVPQSFRDGIIIEHLPNVTGDYTRKCVRIKLPSGRVFKATVHGLLPVNFDTLFADPSIKATLLSSLTDQKKYTMNIKQVTTADKEDPGKILATQFQEINILPRVISGEIETVDLLSDDDSDLDDLNQNLSTEYGIFKVAKMDREILKRHQTKMNQKCIVKLARETLKGNKKIKETTITEIESKIASNTRSSQPSIANLYEIERVINNINNLIDSSSHSASVTNCNEVINTRKPIENVNATIPSKNISNEARSLLKPNILPVQEIIELDDSSNDSVDLVPRSQDPKNTTSIPSVNAQPKEVIIELKGQLLKDLGVETGDSDSSDNDVIFIGDDKAVGPKVTEPPKTALKPNKTCYVKLIKCDDLVKKYEEIANKKCFVPLVRCEESIQNLDKDQVEVKTNRNSSNEDLVDTRVAEESLLKSPSTTALSRSGSISILDDFTTFDVSLSTTVDNELEERSSSPVIDVFETIAAFQNLQQRYSIEATEQLISNANIDLKLLHVSCESEWCFTKNNINMQSKTEILEDKTLCVSCVSECNNTKHSLCLLLKDSANDVDRESKSTTKSEDMTTTCTNPGSDDELIDTPSDPRPEIASIEQDNSHLINDKKDGLETNSVDKEVTSELETSTKPPPENSLMPKLMTLVSVFFQKHPNIVQQLKPNSKRKCTPIDCNAVVRKISRFNCRPATSIKPKIKAYEAPVNNNIEGHTVTSIQVKVSESEEKAVLPELKDYNHTEITRYVNNNELVVLDEEDTSEETIANDPNIEAAVSAQGISGSIQTPLTTANIENCDENKPFTVLTKGCDFLEKCQSSNYVKSSDTEGSSKDIRDKSSNSNEEIHSDVSALQDLKTNSDPVNNNVLCELEVSVKVEKLTEEKDFDKFTDNDKLKNTTNVDSESTLLQPVSDKSRLEWDFIAGHDIKQNTETDTLSNGDVEIREPMNKGVGNLDHEYVSSAIEICDNSKYVVSDKESSQPDLNNMMDEGISLKINNHRYNKKYNTVMCFENTEFDNEIEVLDCSSSSGDSKSLRSESSEQLDFKDDIQTLKDNIEVKSDENIELNEVENTTEDIRRHSNEVEDSDNTKCKEGPAKDSSCETVTAVNTTDGIQNEESHIKQSASEQALLHEDNLNVEDHAEESGEVEMEVVNYLERNISKKAIENEPNSKDLKDVEQQECISMIPKGFQPINNNSEIVNTAEKIEDCTPRTSISPIDKQVTLIYKDNSGLILKGIEYEDPEAGTCYMFPLVHKNSESGDEANDSTDNILRVIQELGVVNKVNEDVNSDDESDYELIIPKVTYGDKRIHSPVSVRDISYKRHLKRKIDMTDVKIVEKKYRKGKNIDFPKLTITAMKDTVYAKEYTRLINYCTSVDFTYSRPFHKEYIDVNQILANWPIEGDYDKNSNADCDIDKNLFIDEDHYERPEVIKDPLQLTLAEELEAECKEPAISSSEDNDSNFNMGFGERSGRVKQNLKSVGGISNLSAATLSDVKQTQPLLLSRTNGARVSHSAASAQDDRLQALKRYTTYIAIRERVQTFFRNTSIELRNVLTDASDKANGRNSDTIGFPYGLNSTEFLEPSPPEYIVQVVQVGQLPVSAAAQNPVTCDPRVTQVSDPSPGQCSAENSPNDDPQSAIKTEYTELTTADLNLPLVQDYVNHNQNINMEPQESNLPYSDENVSIQTEIKSEVKIELMEETAEEREPTECTEPNSQHYLQDKNDVNNIEYSFETNNTNMTSEINPNMQMMYNSTEKQSVPESYPQPKQQNGYPEKMDQIAHAMNAAGITTTCETIDNNRAQALVNMLSQKFRQSAATTQSNNYPKTTSISALALQQALAQILPPPLNQTNLSDNQQATNNVGPQLLHFVQEKSASGNQITLVDNSQTPNGTPVLHIVQNKNNAGTTNGTPSAQSNSFGGLSLVDTGLQQGGNQLLQIVNTGNQKNNAAGQLLKRVNLLANLANVQGSNEQKMVQFVCKSADGKSIQLNAPHQRSMVLRLQPIESPNVQTAPKTIENQDPTANAANSTCQDNSQNEIKSRSVYEENYAKFIQNSSTKPAAPEKSTSLPKFNQAFGKQGYQDGSQKQNEINNETSHLSPVNSTENSECQPQENNVNLDHIGSPPLLVRKPQTATTQQQQTNLVQQIKQSIAPMNLQTMHGGVIYTRQIPVNIGGGQTINLITVPSTDLLDDNAQKPPSGEIEPSIIKIVPQSQPTTNSDVSTSEDAHMGASNDNTHNHQPQPVLTQMRIKLPMLSKNPQVMAGARVVRPSFFQIQRNVIGGANQSVYQQLVLAAAPPLGQQTIRLPQTPTPRPVKVPTESQSSTESQMSSSTLEQLREFDLVLEQVKERSTVQPSSSSSTTFPKMHTPSTDTTDSASSVPPTSSSPTDSSQQSLYAAGTSHSQPLNVSYVTRKSTVTTPTTSTYVRSPDSSGIVDSPSSSTHEQIPHTVTAGESSTSSETPPQPKSSKSGKSKSRSKSSSNPPSTVKVSTVPPKTSTQKPLEDEQTTQRILYILAEYKEQVERSPDKDKPAPRRRNNPPTNPGSSKRKKCGSRRSGRDVSPFYGEDSCRTMGSEDSSCGTSQGDCNESCMDSHSPQDSPRKVARKLTFEQETPTPQPRPQPQRNVIVADGQTITVARGTAGKPATAVLMPANYILPVSMVKGGQQIAIMTNRGPKLLTVGGEGGTTNALLLQRLVGPAGLKPVLTRPGVRHVRLPTAALHNLQTFNFATTTTIQPPERVASPAPAPTPPDLIETRATSSPWADRESREPKPDRASSPEASEPWNLRTTTDPHEYSYGDTGRTENMNRTVLDPIPDRYSPDMEAQRIFDKMFDVESKKSFIIDSHEDSPRCGYDIDASDCDDKAYHQVVHKKEGSSHRQHRLTHVSAAALRHKYAILEHELRLQKSLSEECEDLGVDSPSASELFPEAELLFAASPTHEHIQEQIVHTTPHPTILNSSVIQPDIDDQIATDHLLERDLDDRQDLSLGLEDVGIVTVSSDGTHTITLDHEEFARAHPNTTFHSEPTDETEVQPFTITGIGKGRQITSTIFHANRTPGTVLMAPQTTVISQATAEPSQQVKYADIDNMINSLPTAHANNINLSSVLVKDDGLTRFDSILTDSREIHLSNTASAIIHSTGNATQVIRRVCYDDHKRERDARYLMDEPEGLIAGDDAKMVAEDSSRDAIESMDGRSSPERHAELFWESNSASERSECRRPLDFSSDSDKCCKSPSYDEANSTDSSGIGTHMRLDSVIKEARGVERSGSADGSSADDGHPPLRTYPPKRLFNAPESLERSTSGKTRAGEHSPDPGPRRRASGRGVVKRGCHCCNGSPAPPKPKKSRQKKPTMDFTNN